MLGNPSGRVRLCGLRRLAEWEGPARAAGGSGAGPAGLGWASGPEAPGEHPTQDREHIQGGRTQHRGGSEGRRIGPSRGLLPSTSRRAGRRLSLPRGCPTAPLSPGCSAVEASVYTTNTHMPSVQIFRFSGVFFFAFQGHTRSIWRFPGLGSNQSYSCRPPPQPRQRRILNPQSEARGRTRVLRDASRVLNPLCHSGSSSNVSVLYLDSK